MLGTFATGEEGHEVGDRVVHVKDPTLVGAIKIVEENRLSVMVLWDRAGMSPDDPYEEGDLDFQWANKVVKVDV